MELELTMKLTISMGTQLVKILYMLCVNFINVKFQFKKILFSDFHVTHLDPKHMRTCMVCGEVMSTEEEGEIHQSCHDVDVMCV